MLRHCLPCAKLWENWARLKGINVLCHSHPVSSIQNRSRQVLLPLSTALVHLQFK